MVCATVRTMRAILVAVSATVLIAQSDFRVSRDVLVPMRDGVRLAADVCLPATPGKYPALLARRWRIAENSTCVDAQRASHIVLPVIPR